MAWAMTFESDPCAGASDASESDGFFASFSAPRPCAWTRGAPRSDPRAGARRAPGAGAGRFFGACACASTLLLASPSARAQAENQAAARALFDDARALVKSGDAASACPKFEAANRLYPSVGIALNLADCYEKVGRTASAWTEFGEAASLAGRSNRPDDAAEAKRRQTALEAKLTKLVVRAPRDVAGLVVKNDGEELPAAAWGLAIPVDPGSHEIRAEAPGRSAWTASVTTAGAGQTTTVEVPALAVATSAAAPPAEPPREAGPLAPVLSASAEKSGSSTARGLGWGLVAGGAAIGIGGGVLAGIGFSKASDASKSGTSQEYASGKTLYTVGLVGAIAGGAAVVGGIVVLLTAHGDERSASFSVSPWLSGSAGGVRLGGSW